VVEAVIFDIGNVLIEWNPERVYDSHIGVSRRQALFAEVPMLELNEAVDMGAPFQATFAGAARRHPEWSAEILLWIDLWGKMASPAIPLTVALLRALRARGVAVHALSNFGTETFEIARGMYPFLDEFDIAFVSGHLGMMKPDPQIYQLVEDRLGLRGAALIFVDDRADNIEAAAARGWKTHRFDGPAGWAERLVAEGLLTEGEAGQ
jgi:2-haloacid dehalogenase